MMGTHRDFQPAAQASVWNCASAKRSGMSITLHVGESHVYVSAILGAMVKWGSVRAASLALASAWSQHLPACSPVLLLADCLIIVVVAQLRSESVGPYSLIR